MDLEVYDCTLREGEQADGASFSSQNRVTLFKKLDDFGIDYIELGWPIASKEIMESFKECLKVAKHAKVVAFGSTAISNNIETDTNLLSIINSGAKYACIFGKTSIEHVEKQLKLTKEENLEKIKNSVKFLTSKGLTVFYDAEHYFDGYKDNKEYAIKTLDAALNGGAIRLILCDTSGGILPNEAEKIVKETYLELKKSGNENNLGVHFHNDSGLALANTLVTLPYIKQVQGTINGIGERIGNLNFSEFLPVYIKKLNGKIKVDLKKLKELNEAAFKLSGLNVPESRAFVGDSAFLHKAGVHIDATKKGASYEHEDPEEFGNRRVILMNTLGGRSSIINIAKDHGFKLNKDDPLVKEKIKKLFEELRKMEIKGYRIGTIEAEQFLLLEKYFNSSKKYFEILEWSINSDFMNQKEVSRFLCLTRIDGEMVDGNLEVEGGPVDAAFKTLKKILADKYPEVNYLELLDFHVSIAVSHKEESAVRTRIDFSDENFAKFKKTVKFSGESFENSLDSDNLVNYSKDSDGIKFSTVGVDSNILGSAIEALVKGFRFYIMKNRKNSDQKDLKSKKNIKI